MSVSQNQAPNVVLEDTGLLAVTSGSTATNTTINSAGRLRTYDGGTINGTTTNNTDRFVAGTKIQNDGNFILNIIEKYNFETALSGKSTLVKDNAGIMTYGGTLTQAQAQAQAQGVNVKNGGIILPNALKKSILSGLQRVMIRSPLPARSWQCSSINWTGASQKHPALTH